MHSPTSKPDVRLSLRRLTAPHAMSFGNTLLERGCDGHISFGAFVDVARQWVVERPDQSAFYLAALIALDMSDEECEPRDLPQPSVN